MRKPLLCIALSWLLCVCLSGCGINPKTLQPIAADNAKNITALIENNKRIHNTARELMVSQGSALRTLRVQRVASICDLDIVNQETDKNKVKATLDGKVTALRNSASGGTPQELAKLSPVIGDVAGDLIPAQEALEMCLDVSAAITAAKTAKVKAPYPVLGERLKGVYLIKSWDEGQQALLAAYAEYIATIDRQSSLAIKHAAALEEVSQTDTDVLGAVLGVTKDQDVRDGVLGLIKDGDRKQKASAVFDAFDKAAEELGKGSK